MTEVPKGQRFVGSADATREAGKPAEFPLSPEQQKVIDALGDRVKALEKNIVNARLAASEKLKQLPGSELVRIGAKQYMCGVTETAKQEAKLGGIGAFVGLPVGVVLRGEGQGIVAGAAEGARVLGTLGAALGIESSYIPYNKEAIAKNLPPSKWYDWVISMIGALRISEIPNPNNNLAITGGKFVAATLINPGSIAGFRTMAKGLWQMAWGK